MHYSPDDFDFKQEPEEQIFLVHTYHLKSTKKRLFTTKT